MSLDDPKPSHRLLQSGRCGECRISEFRFRKPAVGQLVLPARSGQTRFWLESSHLCLQRIWKAQNFLLRTLYKNDATGMLGDGGFILSVKFSSAVLAPNKTCGVPVAKNVRPSSRRSPPVARRILRIALFSWDEIANSRDKTAAFILVSIRTEQSLSNAGMSPDNPLRS